MKKSLPLAALAVVSSLAVVAAGVPAASAADDVQTEYGRMMLVLDSSGSMKEAAGGGQTKIEAARTALGAVIDELPDDADVGLQVFGATVFSRNDQGACSDTQVVVQPGTDNRDELRAAVGEYKPYGETPIPAALREAAKAIGGEGKRSVVLVSDGESTCGDPCDVAREVANSGVDIQVDVVGLSVSGQAKRQLQCIAEQGKGTYYDAKDAQELSRSLTRISERAVRPFVVQGAAVAGAASPTDAPVITAGEWRDALPAEGEILHYRVERRLQGSTLWAGVVAQPGLAQQQVQLRFLTDDGGTCGQHADYNGVGGGSSSRLLAVTLPSADSERCADADSLVLTVAKTRWSSGDVDVPMQILVHEEPAVTDVDSLPESPNASRLTWESVDLGGDVQEVVPGNTLGDAPLLEPGVYRPGGIVPGEEQIYRVSLDWGESLQVRGVFAPDDAAFDTYGHLPPPVRLGVINPTGGRASTGYSVRNEYDESLNAYVFPPTRTEQGTRYVHAKTQPVQWRNRERVTTQEVSIPGDYYVVVSQEADEDSVPFDFDLEISTVGEAGAGAPSYADDAEITGPVEVDLAEPEGDAGDRSASAASDEDDETVRLVAGVGAVLVGALVVLSGLLLLGRRRRTNAS